MFDMAEKNAEWRKFMDDTDRAELERAEKLRDAARDNFQAVFRKVKDRCIKRQRRSRDD